MISCRRLSNQSILKTQTGGKGARLLVWVAQRGRCSLVPVALGGDSGSGRPERGRGLVVWATCPKVRPGPAELGEPSSASEANMRVKCLIVLRNCRRAKCSTQDVNFSYCSLRHRIKPNYLIESQILSRYLSRERQGALSGGFWSENLHRVSTFGSLLVRDSDNQF
jgi:hypothetical protein